MGHFTFNATYRTWICKSCQTGVPPASILGHLRGKRHRSHTDAQSALTDAQRIAFAEEEVWKPDPFNPLTVSFQPPPPETRPIPRLAVYDGYGCPERNTYAGRTLDTIRLHRSKAHGGQRRPGRPHEANRPYPIGVINFHRFVKLRGDFKYLMQLSNVDAMAKPFALTLAPTIIN
ncbi:hypothetical protein ASPFODRAFT_213019 [Aspergillus luchuensis CBS 106.47]|uniref:Uncharacterized protein n=1 Tax=Aspergillus luchuensis (strain CBS 106.47) TaxID=1137211 RepID=A0A1M3SZM1_ASPLC|nr:hypothetical protein ASPFODRAFT_213019 [Aspergillus luchuensis CBS 106.47]